MGSKTSKQRHLPPAWPHALRNRYGCPHVFTYHTSMFHRSSVPTYVHTPHPIIFTNMILMVGRQTMPLTITLKRPISCVIAHDSKRSNFYQNAEPSSRHPCLIHDDRKCPCYLTEVENDPSCAPQPGLQSASQVGGWRGRPIRRDRHVSAKGPGGRPCGRCFAFVEFGLPAHELVSAQ